MLVVVGDLHCQLKFLNDFSDFAKKLEIVVSKVKPSKVIFLGDSLHNHSRIHTAELNAVMDLFARIAKMSPVVILVGNHDLVSPGLFLSHQHPLATAGCLGDVTVVDRPQIIDGMVFTPYVPNGRLMDALDTLPSWRDAKVVFAHQEILGAASGGGFVSVSGDKWGEDLPLLISGHIHKHQRVGNVLYIGTPYQTTFGENEDKTISIFDDNWNERRIDLKCIKRITLQTDIGGAETIEIPTNAHVRLEVHTALPQFASFRKSKRFAELVALGVKIVPRLEMAEIVHTNERQTFLDTLRKKVQSEDEAVQGLFRELFSAQVTA